MQVILKQYTLLAIMKTRLPLVVMSFLLLTPALLAQTEPRKGVVEEWADARTSADRTTLTAFIQNWPDQPLYIALAQQLLATLPPNADTGPDITTLQVPPLGAPPTPPPDTQALPAPIATVLPRAAPPITAPPPQTAPLPEPAITAAPAPLAPAPETVALDFVLFTIALLSRPDPDIAAVVSTYYTDRITFYGKDWSRAQVIADKRGFFSRWPERRYEIIPDTTTITCTGNTCSIKAEMLFTAHSPARQATSRGRALFSYVVELRDQPLISLESSTVIERF